MPTQSQRISNIDLYKFMDRVNRMLKEGFSLCEIARYYSIHRNTLRARIRRFESKVEK